MKKGLIELRTSRKYAPGLPKEEYEDEAVDTGFEVDYESFKESKEIGFQIVEDTDLTPIQQEALESLLG